MIAAPKVVPPHAPEATPKAASTHTCIRTATTEDQPAINRLILLACQFTGEPYAPLPELPRKVFVAQSNNKIVGMVVAFIQSGDVQLSHLFVEKQYRRRGLGKALLQAVFEAVGPKTKISLRTDRTNMVARKFFEQSGFERGRLISYQRT